MPGMRASAPSLAPSVASCPHPTVLTLSVFGYDCGLGVVLFCVPVGAQSGVLCVITHTCNPTTREIEAGGLGVLGQPGSHGVTLSQ